jgi:hypothetical protein
MVDEFKEIWKSGTMTACNREVKHLQRNLSQNNSVHQKSYSDCPEIKPGFPYNCGISKKCVVNGISY